MLSDAQVKAIATAANKKINIPIIGEKWEQKILEKAVVKIDKELEEILPDDYAKLLDDISDGLEPGSPADIEEIKKNIVDFLNKKINIPILSEKTEGELFSVAIDIIIDALSKGKKLDTAA